MFLIWFICTTAKWGERKGGENEYVKEEASVRTQVGNLHIHIHGHNLLDVKAKVHIRNGYVSTYAHIIHTSMEYNLICSLP